MGGKFTFADINANFSRLKEEGITGVSVSNDGELAETVKVAQAFGMKVIISLTPDKSHTVKMISPDGERVNFTEKTIKYVSPK